MPKQKRKFKALPKSRTKNFAEIKREELEKQEPERTKAQVPQDVCKVVYIA